MKIVYFSETLPPIRDGVSRTLSYLGETLHKENIDFLFYSPVIPDKQIPWVHRIRPIVSIPFTFHNTYKMGLPYFQDLYRQLDVYMPDIIHVVSPTILGVYGINYAQRRGIPVVSSYHTHFISYFPYYGMGSMEGLGWKYLHWFYNRCSATYAPSPSAAYALRKQGIERVELWQRGIDTTRFSPSFRNGELRSSIGVDAKTPILLFVARLVKEKDLDDLIIAARLLDQKRKPFKLVIVGDGPEREYMERELPNAHFTGYLTGRDLSEMYASSDLFIFPSTTETFGNVILEAFASGLPAVTVDKGGVADIVTDGINGFVARGNDPKDFSEKITMLLDNPDFMKRLGYHAKITSADYNWDAINAKLIASYEHLTGKYRHRPGIHASVGSVGKSQQIKQTVSA